MQDLADHPDVVETIKEFIEDHVSKESAYLSNNLLQTLEAAVEFFSFFIFFFKKFFFHLKLDPFLLGQRN